MKSEKFGSDNAPVTTEDVELNDSILFSIEVFWIPIFAGSRSPVLNF